MACRYFLGDKELKGDALISYMKNLPHEEKLKVAPEIAKDSYSRLSWTPGEAQAARYDLSKTFNRIKATPVIDQHGLKYEIKGYDKTGDYATMMNVVPENELPNVVGKELAQKIVDQTQGKKLVEFKGLDLKIGGEGMKGFYDQMIPKALEKIGKEHGVKVQEGQIENGSKVMRANPKDWRIVGPDGKGLKKTNGEPLSFESEAEAKANLPKSKIHYIDIPQSLKDQAMHKGFPLFSSGGYMLIPVDHTPNFGDKK